MKILIITLCSTFPRFLHCAPIILFISQPKLDVCIGICCYKCAVEAATCSCSSALVPSFSIFSPSRLFRQSLNSEKKAAVNTVLSDKVNYRLRELALRSYSQPGRRFTQPIIHLLAKWTDTKEPTPPRNNSIRRRKWQDEGNRETSRNVSPASLPYLKLSSQELRGGDAFLLRGVNKTSAH